MNPLATELNATLEGTAAGRLLSGLGREMFFPKGIVAQTAEANGRAHRFNATVGMAFEEGEPIMLSSLRERLGGLSSREAVAYAPTPGVPELRELWKREMIRKNPDIAEVATTTPMVTGGLTNGLFQVAELFLDPGDTVVIPDLFWGNYRLMMQTRREAVIETFTLFGEDGAFNTAGLAAAVADKAKAMVLLNFPNNPTGYTPTAAEATEIAQALIQAAESGTDLLVVSDDAYFGLFYEDGLLTESFFSLMANAHPRILAAKVDGATKEDFAWGLRVGFVTFAGKGMTSSQLEALEKKLMGSIRSTVSNSSRIAQTLLVDALGSEVYQQEKLRKRDLLKTRYQTVRSLLSRLDSGPLSPLPFNSGYFMAFVCEGISAEQLRLKLLDRGIGTIAIGERYLRVAYSTVDQADLEELYGEIFTAARELAG